ncbi:MAG: ATP-dependent DNA helicase RecG [SAR202 cluster bacterium]|nr:ATP-dependent DNA helicase RecG [SAR202 cluster bacterium]|tara:strand:+ start:6560 stop:8944 length:2385 start_codon:yes stop_codon:yes gene_type:complete
MTITNFDTLEKILVLEANKGYSDTAVIGGLDKFVSKWIKSHKVITKSELPVGLYSNMSLVEKRDWIDAISKLIEEKHTIANGSKSIKETDFSFLNKPVTELPKVSTKMVARLNKLGIYTVKDLMYFFPRRHNDYSVLQKVDSLQLGIEQTVIVNVWDARQVMLGGKHKATEAIVGDDTGNVRVVWFNQPYLAKKFRVGDKLVLSGRVGEFRNSLVFESPEYEIVSEEELIHTGRLVPVYPSTEGIVARTFRSLIKQVLDKYLHLVVDPYPDELLESAKLIDLAKAINQYHYPLTEKDKEEARYRLAFDELFMIQLYVLLKRHDWRSNKDSIPISVETKIVESTKKSLPFALTGAQNNAVDQILEDISQENPMSRLLQGDVGSGKTAVALIALLVTVYKGYQGAMMAPTEILVQQHFNTVANILQGTDGMEYYGHWFKFNLTDFSKPIRVGILTGSLKARQKREINEMMSAGTLDIVFGTHALLQENVNIPKLSMAIVDEQHRFGVMQRTSLRNKTKTPHLLVMSATPIPRSLALTLYGDLDISVLDELPPGRQKISTYHAHPNKRDRIYKFMRSQINEGRQAFVVCPLIEESDILQTRAAKTEFDILAGDIFPDLSVGLLHGRMSSRDKIDVMDAFQRQEIDILVSTPVIEVGIDNPNAVLILIEGADRFGLAQLHQFRGRVGRGNYPSYCILLSDYPSSDARDRLDVMQRFSDGFAVAEEDLRFRGPGDFFGTRQSGLPDLRIARLSDQNILSEARRVARLVLTKDPTLDHDENKLLASKVSIFSELTQAEVN